MRVLVAGGTGFIGNTVCSLLRTRGHRVMILSRNPRKQPDWYTWNDVRSQGLPDCEALITLCGENFLSQAWTARRKAQLESSRIDTTKELVSLCHRSLHPPRVFVQASGVGFYPASLTVDYDEHYSGPPASDYAGR